MGQSPSKAGQKGGQALQAVTIVLRPEARADLEEASRWYEAQRPGLGGDFLQQVDAVFRRMQAQPTHFPKVQGELRRALLRRFPYSAYFLTERRRIVVIGVLHQRRDPWVWRQRAQG
jgi:plasmid stabilization system protein ParE